MSEKGVNQLKNRARREEQRENWSRAIELYTQALNASRQRNEAFADLSLYNRIGDIYLRIGQKNTAVRYYEQAIEGYAEQELHTSAIALCNKVLRVVPGKTSIFLQLGRLHLATNLIADARDHYHRFATETRARGDLEGALDAVEELVSETGDPRTLKLWISWLAEETDDAAEERVTALEADLERHGLDPADVMARVRAGGDPTSEEEVLQGSSEVADPLAGAFLSSDEPAESPLPLLDEPAAADAESDLTASRETPGERPPAEELEEREAEKRERPEAEELAAAREAALHAVEAGGAREDTGPPAEEPSGAEEVGDSSLAIEPAGAEPRPFELGSRVPDEEETEAPASSDRVVGLPPWVADESEAETAARAEAEPALPDPEGDEDEGPDLGLVAGGPLGPERGEPAAPPVAAERGRARASKERPERPCAGPRDEPSWRPGRDALEIAASAGRFPGDDGPTRHETIEEAAEWAVVESRSTEIALEDTEPADVDLLAAAADGEEVQDDPCEAPGRPHGARSGPPFRREELERFVAGGAGLEDLVESARLAAEPEPPVTPALGPLPETPAESIEEKWPPKSNGAGRRAPRRSRSTGPHLEPAETDEAAPLEGAEPLEGAAAPGPPRAAAPEMEEAEGREAAPGADEALAEGLALHEAGRHAEAIPHLERAQLSPAHFAQAYEALEACRHAVSTDEAREERPEERTGAAIEPEPTPGPTESALEREPERTEPVCEPEAEPEALAEPEPEPEPEPLAEPEPAVRMETPAEPALTSGTRAEEEEGEEAFREWVESAPASVLRRVLAELEERAELRKASLVLDRLVHLDAADPDLHRARLESAERRGDHGQAIEAHVDLAASLERAGRAAEARRTYERLLKLDPANPAATSALERLEGERPGTEEEASDPIRPTEPMRDSMLTDRSSPAGDTASQSFGSDPLDLEAGAEKPRPYSGVAGGREAATDFEQLLNEFRAQLHDRPRESDTVTRTELGASLKEMGRLDDAIRELQAAVREPHAPPLAYELLGEAFLEKGQARVAVRLLQEALEESVRGDREMLGVLYQLGLALERLEERPNALACYERIFSVDIDYKDVQERIANCSR